MIFWILVITITLMVLASLFIYSKDKSDVSQNINEEEITTSLKDEQTNVHFKKQLLEIETDLAKGFTSPEEAQAAKGELAREMLRLKYEESQKRHAKLTLSTPVIIITLISIGLASFGTYFYIGKPELPAQPLALREMPVNSNIDIEEAVAKVEAQLAKDPDDGRAWSVLGPVYMQQSRFDEAVKAYRNVLRLLPPSADAKTDLAEALMMASDGVADGEPIELLKSAIELDKNHIRSRFYLASELTRAGSYQEAVKQWQDLLALSNGDEAWIEVAKEGLEFATAGLNGAEVSEPAIDEDQSKLILDMVASLSTRLAEEGGSVEEWTRLVRSLLVLGENEKAQDAFTSAKKAYPNESDRNEMNKLASEAGLE